jgi:hypothetical protein
VTFSVLRLPHPAENDQPVQGWPRRHGASRPATVTLAARARVVVRPVYCRRPSSSYLPSSRLLGAARGPVTAPTIASLMI